MESITLELAVDEADPYDRTLSLLMRTEDGLVAHRAWRLREDLSTDGLTSCLALLVHRWCRPALDDADGFGPLLEQLERAVAVPF